jgi:hypothetical protein
MADATTEFPRTIGGPATRALAQRGWTSYEQLRRVTRRELLALHGVGPKAVRILEAELAQRGLGFADERD